MTPGTIFVDKTKYIELLEGTQDYSYMFLRPSRFGKSTFLNTLCQYYDIAEAETWKGVFGGLYIGAYPTAFHSKHLILKFDLSNIGCDSTLGAESSFNEYMYHVIFQFLEKYSKYLGTTCTERILNRKDGTSILRAALVRDILSFVLTQSYITIPTRNN